MANNSSAALELRYLPVDKVKPSPHNARTHSKRQIRQIFNSLQEFGWTNPILIDRDGNVIAGHGRLQAAEMLGLTSVPTITLEDLSPEQIRAYVVADNRLAELAGWDHEILTVEFEYLLTLDVFDVTLTGFEVGEIDQILLDGAEVPDSADILEELTSISVTRPGDLWKLGKHSIFCGSALEPNSYVALLGNRKANLIFADPPYNVRIAGNVSGRGAVRHGDFAMASGEMTDDQFRSFLNVSLRLLAQYSTSGSVHFLCMDWRHAIHLLGVGEQVYGELLNLCVWVKDKGGMGSLYRSAHELVFVFKNGRGKHRNNVQLGVFGRDRTNVWRYPSASTFSHQGDEGNLLSLHPTVKPVAMIADAILDCSARGEIVLDSFLGSGSTLIAAERTGRICFGIELDPQYVDVAIRRWQRHTGAPATHLETGKPFDELAAERGDLRRA
jgi:DNA modification methylase